MLSFGLKESVCLDIILSDDKNYFKYFYSLKESVFLNFFVKGQRLDMFPQNN